jgi:hypothetical protein
MRPIRMLNVPFTMAALAAMLAAAPAPAQAEQGRNAAAAAGAVGGLALGAALGAASQPRTITSPGGMVYEDRAPVVSDEDCTVTRRRVWVDGYGWRMVRRQVCE